MTVAAKTGDYGWSAEFAIPFATLRYPRDDGAVWGLNFQRNIRRRNEIAFWSKLEQQWSLFRPPTPGRSRASRRRADAISSSRPTCWRRLAVRPPGPISARTTSRPAATSSTASRPASPRRHLQHRLRPGRSRRAAGQPRSLQPVLSREAAVLPRRTRASSRWARRARPSSSSVAASASRDGSPIPIEAGGRLLSRKIGHRNLGLLAMRTEETDDFQGNDYSIVRVSRELPNRSNLGGLLIERQGAGDPRQMVIATAPSRSMASSASASTTRSRPGRRAPTRPASSTTITPTRPSGA